MSSQANAATTDLGFDDLIAGGKKQVADFGTIAGTSAAYSNELALSFKPDVVPSAALQAIEMAVFHVHGQWPSYLTLNAVIELHDYHIQQSGGSSGIRDKGALESAIAQPRATFDGEDLYPTIVEKAVALGFSLIQNHAFVDGNELPRRERTGYRSPI